MSQLYCSVLIVKHSNTQFYRLQINVTVILQCLNCQTQVYTVLFYRLQINGTVTLQCLNCQTQEYTVLSTTDQCHSYTAMSYLSNTAIHSFIDYRSMSQLYCKVLIVKHSHTQFYRLQINVTVILQRLNCQTQEYTVLSTTDQCHSYTVVS